MNRLIQGMFGSEFNPKKADAFPYLRCGQMRSLYFCHNAGWYNKHGEKIGWGDLNLSDFKKLRDGLLSTEAFLILSESDSFWKFVERNPGIIGSMCSTSEEMLQANQKYAIDRAMFLIVKGKIYLVRDEVPVTQNKTYKPDYKVPSGCQDVEFELITHQQAAKRIPE